MKERINLLDSVNPLDGGLWPKYMVNKILGREKNYYLQYDGWNGLWDGKNDLPCIVDEDGNQMAVDMGTKANGEQKKGRQQYPNSFNMGLHKLVALVTLPNPDPENFREVDHINDIRNPMTRLYAAELHQLFGRKVDAGKLVWGAWNLRWASSSENGRDSKSEDHKRFEKDVPYEDICSFICRLDEKSKEKSVNQIERDLKEKNHDYAMDMSFNCWWHEELNNLTKFITQYRHFDRDSYKWAINWLSDSGTFEEFETKIADLPDPILHDIFRNYDYKQKVIWKTAPPF